MADFELPGYELYERIGKGGMATVYRALHLNLDREVAIKVMDPAMNSDEHFSERFIREARISARLVHPHILQIYDVNNFDGYNYIAMELLGFGDLADIIYSSMQQKTIYQIMEQMTHALDYASGRGYVHRDIKPSNIMLRAKNEYVLGDFGIARAANSGTQMTQTGLMVGTPSYMSPEQAKGQQVDGRSDLYAMAVLCYEMLTKNLPYESGSAVTTAVKHLTEDIPTLPEALALYQPFFDQALAKLADDRYQTGREMNVAFLAASAEFDDDQVLIEAVATSPSETEGSAGSGERTSVAPMDQTRVSQTSLSASSSSRPYKLDGTSQRERLVSGTYAPGTQGKGQSSSAVRLLLVAVVLGGLGFGGYTYWQDQQRGASVDLRAVTGELASAYGAMNNDDLPGAAAAFHRVLSVDSSNGAAQQGMAEVGTLYEAAITQALQEQDGARAQVLIGDYGLYFSDSGKWADFQGALEQMGEEKRLAAAQSERLEILLGRASQQIQEQQLAEARASLDQARAIDPDYAGLQEVREALVNAETAAMANEERWADYTPGQRQEFEDAIAVANLAITENQFDEAEDSLSQAARIAPEMPDLAVLGDTLSAAREATAEQQAQIEGSLERADAAVAALATDPAQAAGAAGLYQEVLLVDPDNSAAQQGLTVLVDYFITSAGNAAAAGNFEGAGEILATAEALVPDQQTVAGLQDKLPELEAAWEKEQLLAAETKSEIDALLSQADAAMAEYTDDSSKALEAADFDLADEILVAAEQAIPGQAAVSRLQSEQPGLEKAWEDQQVAAAQEQALAAREQQAIDTANKGMVALSEAQLDVAQQAYDEVAGTYPGLDATVELKKQLAAAYINATREQIQVRELDRAEEYLALGLAMVPGDPVWTELEVEIESARGGGRRRLGAY
jgi:serine/threonine-protein kinase PpkA